MKLIIFALSLGIVPISSYFLSRDYLWNGVCAVDPCSILTYFSSPLCPRQHNIRCHHSNRCRQCGPCRIHCGVVTRRGTAQDQGDREATCGVEEGSVARQSPSFFLCFLTVYPSCAPFIVSVVHHNMSWKYDTSSHLPNFRPTSLTVPRSSNPCLAQNLIVPSFSEVTLAVNTRISVVGMPSYHFLRVRVVDNRMLTNDYMKPFALFSSLLEQA